eukprot:gi/632991025/ref/XP_007884439.1/ PREDICTED: LRRN4 C-terminal-like protein [Callorhinchus milii]
MWPRGKAAAAAFTGPAVCILLALAVIPGSGATPVPGALPGTVTAPQTVTALRAETATGTASSAPAAVTAPQTVTAPGAATAPETASSAPAPGAATAPQTTATAPETASSAPAPGAATAPQTTVAKGRSLPDDIVIIRLGGEDEDEYEYEEEDQETVTEPVPGVTTRLCDYDRCRHGQRPCAELQLLAGPSNPCLCPGMADEDAPPDPPQLLPPTTITDSSAQLHWCEPLSTVRGYRLLLSNDADDVGHVDAGHVTDGARAAQGPAHRPDGPAGGSSSRPTLTTQPLAPDARLHTLTGLRSATAYRVCVEAFNAAGQSRRLEGVAPRSSPERRHLDGPGLELGPCRRFTTKPSRYTVAAVGASGLLALLLVAVAAGACCVVRRRSAGKPPAGGAAATASASNGTSNPAYRGGGRGDVRGGARGWVQPEPQAGGT